LAAGVNTYTYVGNNPVNYADPYGLRSFSVTIKSDGNPSVRGGSMKGMFWTQGEHAWLDVNVEGLDPYNVSTYPINNGAKYPLNPVNNASIDHPRDKNRTPVSQETFTFPNDRLNDFYDGLDKCSQKKWTHVNNCSSFASCVINNMFDGNVIGSNDPYTGLITETPKSITDDINNM
jgi:hypothetical protein